MKFRLGLSGFTMGRARVWWLTGQYDNVMVATNQKADDSVKVIEKSAYNAAVTALKKIASTDYIKILRSARLPSGRLMSLARSSTTTQPLGVLDVGLQCLSSVTVLKMRRMSEPVSNEAC